MTTTSHKQADHVSAADLVLRPRLRHDVLFADTGDGVMLRDADGGYVVKGRTAYKFTAALAPYLTGDLTVSELCEQVPQDRWPAIVHFVQTLIAHGFARDVRRSAVEVPPLVKAQFGAQLNYVEHYADDAAERFLRFRTAKVLVLGTGRVATAAATALLRNGLESIGLETSVAARLSETVSELTAAECPPTIRTDVEDALAPGGYDFVIASADDIGMPALRRVVDAGVRGGPVVLPATVIGSNVVMGPITSAASAPCWTCAMLRYSTNTDQLDSAAMWQAITDTTTRHVETALDPQLAAMVGNMLAFELFRLTTGSLAPETAGGVVVQNTQTLEARRARLWAHPLCRTCADHQVTATSGITPSPMATYTPPYSGFRPVDRLDLDELLGDLDELVDDHVGILSAFDDEGLDQSPLKVSRVRLGPPTGRLVTGFDLHYVPVARQRALRAAMLVYVGQIADTRTMTTDSADVPVPPGELVTWSGLPMTEEPGAWTAATSMVSNERHHLPSSAVYPFSSLNSDAVFERTSAGDGAGSTLGEAVHSGLMSAVVFSTLRAALAGKAECRSFDPGVPAVGSELEFLLRTLANLAVEVDLIKLGRYRNVFVVMARTTTTPDSLLWTVEAALSEEAAVVAALRDLVGQALGYLDLGAPLLPGLAAETVLATGEAVTPTGTTGTVTGLVGELADSGHDVLVTETTTPDLRAQGSVVTVRVLLRCPR